MMVDRRQLGARSKAASKRARPSIGISLLGGFQVETEGSTIAVPEGSQRLLAFLALKGRSVRRQTVAGTLWPIVTDAHASSSLRSALARLPDEARATVAITAQDLRLSDDVTVDLWDWREIAKQLLAPQNSSASVNLGPNAIQPLSAELLPNWYDDWVLFEAEGWRQLRLHALEALAQRLVDTGHYSDAIAAALAAVRAEPLRESPRAALIQVHIAEGNPSEALREFAMYRKLLMLELGVEPSERLAALVRELGTVTPQ
jgi:DNA-binding SARP family transcriptional activator